MARKDVAAIVSGAGWACDFVGQLISGLVAKGHTLEEIHSLVTAQQRPAMDRIVNEVSNFLRRIGNVLPIPRSTPFNPTHFLGEGWSIWRGPANGDGLSGDEEQDNRSLALTELDLSQVQLVTCLKGGETSITGEERIRRLKAVDFIRLDAQVFQTLWKNKHLIPESWKEETNNCITYIFFDGTTLRSSGGRRYVLCLSWHDSGWSWDYYWLESDRYARFPSAVFAS